jgi:hypothetical protein
MPKTPLRRSQKTLRPPPPEVTECAYQWHVSLLVVTGKDRLFAGCRRARTANGRRLARPRRRRAVIACVPRLAVVAIRRRGTDITEALTVRDVMDKYLDQHVAVPERKKAGEVVMEAYVERLRAMPVPAAHGATIPLGSKTLDAVTLADLNACVPRGR